MTNIVGYNIEISKGDDLDLFFTFLNFDGTLKILYPSDTILFCVKTSSTATTNIYEKELVGNGTSQINLQITGEELNEIEVGRYFYDLRIEYSNGVVYTPFRPAQFNVASVIGNPY